MRSKFLSVPALVVILAASPAALEAAPDQTLGMALMAAKVNASGNLLRGVGAVSAEKISTGTYRVIFSRDIYPNCMYVATVTAVGPTGTFGFVDIDETIGNVKSILVYTRAPNNTVDDRGFDVFVLCGK